MHSIGKPLQLRMFGASCPRRMFRSSNVPGDLKLKCRNGESGQQLSELPQIRPGTCSNKKDGSVSIPNAGNQ